VAMLADPLQLWSDAGSRAMRLLLALAAESAGRAAAIGAGAVPVLVAALRARWRGEAQHAAIELLGRLAAADAGGLGAERVRAGLVLDGSVPRLVEALEPAVSGLPARAPAASEGGAAGADAHAALLAARALAHVSTDPGNSAKIVALGAVPPLVALLALHAAPDLAAEASFALSAIASTNKGRQAVHQAGALPALVALMEAGSTAGAKARAAQAVAALAARDPKDFAPAMADDADVPVLPLDWRLFDSRVVAALAALLRGGCSECRAQAARAVLNLAQAEQSHEDIIAAGALPPLLQMATEGEPAERGNAATALRFLSVTAREEIEARVVATVSALEEDPLRREVLLQRVKHYCLT